VIVQIRKQKIVKQGSFVLLSLAISEKVFVYAALWTGNQKLSRWKAVMKWEPVQITLLFKL
jgi:hypothetical protein